MAPDAALEAVLGIAQGQKRSLLERCHEVMFEFLVEKPHHLGIATDITL
jgi:hypothetical protein